MPNDEKEVCAVILAGGQSRRMGFDKALLDIEGRPMIQAVADQARLVAARVLISSNDMNTYQFLGLPIVADNYPGQGPLAGLHAAMIRMPNPMFLLLACDLPDLHGKFLSFLILCSEGYDAVIPSTSDGRVHPLCALYRRTCLTTIEKNLSLGINRVTDLFQDPSLRVRWLRPQDGGFDDSDLYNLNTPADLEHYRARSRTVH